MCGKGASFTARFGGKNGVDGYDYNFEVAVLTNRGGKYSDRMIEACNNIRMKPVCDHRSYCGKDTKAIFLGQTHHLAYRPHRNNNNYSPPGLAAVRDKWNGLCSYTGNARGNYALCNVPINTHAWRTPGQYNPGFICAKIQTFQATLGGRNEVGSNTYDFTVVSLSNRGGKYSDRMIEACTKVGMKPVCDHRNYCSADTKSLYLGQDHHLGYAPHRNHNGYVPTGFSAIANKWTGLCSYTANANRNYALCNIPTNTHAWRTPGQYNPGFVCGKTGAASFRAAITSKNGAMSREYMFQMVKLTSKSGAYSNLMVAECAKVGMKPVCDHRSYCGTDNKAVFLGQTHHMAYKPHRRNNNYAPAGLASIQHYWDGLCSYTASANGNAALCNIPKNTHAWRQPSQANPGFICAKGASFEAKLEGKNGVAPRTYEFEIGKLVNRRGSYSDRMVEVCKKYGMKPVCDHRNYCRNDARAIYIGQTHHIAYRPHRNNNGYMPGGFSYIKDKWNTLCSYTNRANGNYALCNIPINTHAWRHPGQYNPGFMCAKPAEFRLRLEPRTASVPRSTSSPSVDSGRAAARTPPS